MTDITAALVKELRERTGVGMMECKRALQATLGDIEKAIEEMRKSGVAKAAKKAGRVAAEGRICIARDGDRAAMVEVNCETDFVARDPNFVNFVKQVAGLALAHNIQEVEVLKSLSLEGSTVDEIRQALIAKIGENMNIRRVALLAAPVLGSYTHQGDKIGVLAAMEGGSADLAKEMAMQVAANKPEVVQPEDMPASLVEKEREIFICQAKESGKPDDIIQKMVDGRITKFLNESSLIGQPFFKDPDITVGKLLKQKSAKVIRFIRFEVGEGIEKQETDFVADVMAQVKANS